MPDQPKYRPVFAAFTIPIEAGDLEWIGTLSVLWSQVEYLVEAWIYHLQGVSFEERRETELPRDITRKATKLSALAGNALAIRERRVVLDLCERIALLAPKRNIAVHGHWARLSDHDDAPAAVSWFKVPPGEPILRLLPVEIPDLAVEAGAISRGLYDALYPRGAFSLVEHQAATPVSSI